MSASGQELEAKFLEVDREDILDRLSRQRTTLNFDGKIKAVYLKDPSKKNDDRVTNRVRRLRAEERPDVIEWTIKTEQEVRDARLCDEQNVVYVQGTTIKQVLNMLEMNGIHDVIQEVRKLRISQEIFVDGERAYVDIDDMYQPMKIGTYLEIEAQQIETIRKTAKMLGLKWDDRKLWSTKKLLAHYGYANGKKK